MKSSVATAIVVLALLVSTVSNASAQQGLTPERSIELALENNVELRNSIEELEAAEHVRRNAFTSWFPRVNAAGAALRAKDPLFDLETGGGDLPVYDGDPAHLSGATEFAFLPGSSLGFGEETYVGALTLSQPLFAGGRILNGNRLASLGVDVRETMHELTRADVVVETETQYWQIVSLEEKLRTIEAFERFLGDLEEEVVQAYAAGLILRNDVLRVQLQASELSLNRSSLTNARQLAMMAFCQHLGIPYEPTLQLASNLADVTPGMHEQVDHHSKLLRRDELRLLEASVEAARLETSMAIGENLPAVVLGISQYVFQMDDADARWNTLGFLTVKFPVSGWWGGSHKIAERRNRERIAENNRANSEELLLLQMDKAWKDLEVALDQVLLSRQARNLAQENLDVNHDAYDNGLITISDLLEAQAAWQEANNRLIDSIIGHRMRELQYLRVTGGLKQLERESP